MRHAGPTRRELGLRTAFNLLGPLTNPARAPRQIVGVPRPELTELLARALMMLGSTRAWVVHGADGLDEISTTGYTKVSECRDGAVHTFYVHPAGLRADESGAGGAQGRRMPRPTPPSSDRCSPERPEPRATWCCSTPARRCSSPGAPSRCATASGRRRRRSIAGAAQRDARSRWRSMSHAEVAGVSAGPDLLATIVAATRRITASRREREPLAGARAPGGGGRAARASSSSSGCGGSDGFNVIAECKRRSPSRGVLAADYDPVRDRARLCRRRRRGHLGADRADVLRRRAGASRGGARRRAGAAAPQGLRRGRIPAARGPRGRSRCRAADRGGARPAGARSGCSSGPGSWGWRRSSKCTIARNCRGPSTAGARIIGVNNRNLRTLQVDVTASDDLAARMPADVVAVSESGLQSRADLERLAAAGLPRVPDRRALHDRPGSCRGDPAADRRGAGRRTRRTERHAAEDLRADDGSRRGARGGGRGDCGGGRLRAGEPAVCHGRSGPRHRARAAADCRSWACSSTRSLAEIVATVAHTGIRVVQLHGDEPRELRGRR